MTLLLQVSGPHFGTERAPVVAALEALVREQRPDVLVLALNTTRRWRHVNGAVSAAQADRVARRCTQAHAAQRRIVVVHQPVAVVRPRDAHNLLHGRDAAVRRWSAAGVDLVLGGHIHLPFVLPLQERWADLHRPMWAVQAGTAVSRRVRAEAGNSVNLIRIGNSAGAMSGTGTGAITGTGTGTGTAPARPLQVERWDHTAAAQCFECVAVHRLPARHGG